MPKRKAGPLEPSYRPPLWERSQIRARSPKRRELFVTRVKDKQLKTLRLFRTKAEVGAWGGIHHAHFDWWMFPIEDGSHDEFNVYSQEDIDGLVSDDEWLPRYREAVTLMLAAWGWDAEGRTMVTDAGRDQGWSNWDVRLAKVVRSLYLFEQKDLMESAQHYARLVQRDHKAGQSFTYGRIVLDELLYFSLPRRGKQPTAADAPGAAADTTADPDGPVAAIHECICDASEAYPIVGIRHHKIGTDIDLSQDEFDKLDGEAKADFELILKPGDAAIPYSLAAHHAAAAVGKAASVAASEAPAPAPPAPPMSPTSAYLYAAGMALATSAE